MMRDLVLRRVAEKELDESVAFYEKEEEGLGKKFRAAIEKYFQRIQANPEQFPKVRSEVRRAVVRNFPFVIHFLVEDNRIVVLSVFHTSRDPERVRWRR